MSTGRPARARNYRALAVTGSVAIAFGWHLSSADWMPVATLIAMKPSLQQSTIRGVQRLVGATLGAAIAAVFLVTVTSHHALEEIIILLPVLAQPGEQFIGPLRC
jgi:uncharacterized membrane protein YgaE (UPF0421/DUF939 family)